MGQSAHFSYESSAVNQCTPVQLPVHVYDIKPDPANPAPRKGGCASPPLEVIKPGIVTTDPASTAPAPVSSWTCSPQPQAQEMRIALQFRPMGGSPHKYNFRNINTAITLTPSREKLTGRIAPDPRSKRPRLHPAMRFIFPYSPSTVNTAPERLQSGRRACAGPGRRLRAHPHQPQWHRPPRTCRRPLT